MQVFCIDMQRKAIGSMVERQRSAPPGALDGIRVKCAEEWPGDYKMRDFCEDQQLKAYQALH
jgi:hypothetical protein